MTLTFSIFTFKDGNRNDGLTYLQTYLEMGKRYGLIEGSIAAGYDNPNQFVVAGTFENKDNWQKLVDEFEVAEDGGLVELMPLLAKPPKLYSFEVIE